MRTSAMLYMMAVGLLAAASAVKAGDCGKPCPAECPQPANCQKAKKTCIRIDAKKTVTHTHYSCKEEEICKDRCSTCGLFGKKSCDGCKEDCDRGSCGKVRTRRKLVKKFVTEEKCITKCVPVDSDEPCQPAKKKFKLFERCEKPCAADCSAAVAESAPAKTPEALPVQPKPVEPMKK